MICIITVSISDYSHMAGQPIKTTRKGCARKWTFSKWVPCPGTGLKGLMKSMAHLSLGCRSLKRISNLGPHKYESPCQKLGQEIKGSLRVPQSLLAEGGGISFWATMLFKHLSRGGAVKSLARPTSPCHRTESIVSLERGVCSYSELQVFSYYRG
jgi:hypothetical protein